MKGKCPKQGLTNAKEVNHLNNERKPNLPQVGENVDYSEQCLKK